MSAPIITQPPAAGEGEPAMWLPCILACLSASVMVATLLVFVRFMRDDDRSEPENPLLAMVLSLLFIGSLSATPAFLFDAASRHDRASMLSDLHRNDTFVFPLLGPATLEEVKSSDAWSATRHTVHWTTTTPVRGCPESSAPGLGVKAEFGPDNPGTVTLLGRATQGEKPYFVSASRPNDGPSPACPDAFLVSPEELAELKRAAKLEGRLATLATRNSLERRSAVERASVVPLPPLSPATVPDKAAAGTNAAEGAVTVPGQP